MDQSTVDSRIEAILKRKTDAASNGNTVVIGPYQEEHEVKIETGSTILPAAQNIVGLGQVDATVPSVRTRAQELAEREADRRGTAGQEGTIGDRHEMPSGEGSEQVKIGTVTLRKSGLEGFEKRFTPLASDYQLVLEDGTVINSVHEIVRELHKEVWKIKQAKAAK